LSLYPEPTANAQGFLGILVQQNLKIRRREGWLRFWVLRRRNFWLDYHRVRPLRVEYVLCNLLNVLDRWIAILPKES